ncbi:MAG: trypsin-like peptidase domain-containing protein [Clostridia bacterium]|nr:trypsin-like peptidase domain-containing protein [Clostridia bacterium]
MLEKKFGEDGMDKNTEAKETAFDNNTVNETPENKEEVAETSEKKAETAHWSNSDMQMHEQMYNADHNVRANQDFNNRGFDPRNSSQQNYNTNPYGNANYNTNSGEYRYRPPYATYGSNVPPHNPYDHHMNNYGYSAPQQPFEAPKEKKAKKVKGRTFSTGAVAILLVACILISFGAGLGGAYLSLYLSGNGNGGNVISGGGDDMIIYKSAMVTDADGNEITTNLTVSGVADIVSDSVVEISTEVMTSYGPFQYVSDGAGSGVIISENGYIITNNHVIAGESNSVADTITVRLKDTTEYEAKVVGTDAESDIALLKIEATGLKAAIVGDSDKLVVGENIVAVGNPLGELGGTVTSGIVSATGRTINVDGTEMKLIQIDAAVNPGNSGGGLFNLKGELVGIVNAKSTGTGIEGLGFAIPVKDAINVSEQIKTNGYVTGRTYIGVSFLDVTDAFTAYRYFGTQTLGVYVYQALEGYNDQALMTGDRIVAVNGTEIVASDDIKAIVKSANVGDVLKFTVYRKGVLTEVDVTCYEYVPETSVNFEQQ